MSFKFQIGSRFVGDNCPPFIIAELSGNHNRSKERAISLIKAAHKAGAHAIKLQTYTPDTMTLPGSFKILDSESLWAGKDLYELYQEAFTPWEWHEELFAYARELGLIAFSTPFDETAVDFLESCNTPAYKIASFENTDLPLLKKVASTGKPVIMSTGGASLADIDQAVTVLRQNGCTNLALLKCTSTYPADPINSNLKTIPHMHDIFGCHIGLSDHTLGIGAAIAAISLGAGIIEKHFTIRRLDGGVDSAFSLEPEELAMLVQESLMAWKALGNITYGVLEDETKNVVFKRSVYAIKDIKVGQEITLENTRILRPALGVQPKDYTALLGCCVTKDIKRGSAIQWSDLLTIADKNARFE